MNQLTLSNQNIRAVQLALSNRQPVSLDKLKTEAKKSLLKNYLYDFPIDEIKKLCYNLYTKLKKKERFVLMTRNEQIEKFMKNLGISYEEAEQLLEDDENDVTVELTAEQKKVAKAMAQGDRKKETAPRKRERKPDDLKRNLVKVLSDSLMASGIVDGLEVVNLEREISFISNGETFRLTLAKPRKAKEN